MNFFDQYGIKEVANVVFYSVTKIGDEEICIPVLMLDSLKVSSLSKSSDTIVQKGGKGNAAILSWSYTRDIKLRLEDALFSEASLDLYLNGRFAAKNSSYMSAVIKLNIANKYGKMNYHPVAKPSPELTDEEIGVIFTAAQESGVVVNPLARDKMPTNSTKYIYTANLNEYVAENRKILLENYYKRKQRDYSEGAINFIENLAMPEKVIKAILDKIDSLKKIQGFSNDIYKSRCIDRMERCVVKDKRGLTISAAEQKQNFMRFLQEDKSGSFVIYYDPKTMQPFFGLNSNLEFNTDTFTLRPGTYYLKFTRTVDLIEVPDMIIGTELTINPETFPGEYKVVGETKIRGRNGKDQRMQLILNRVAVSPTTNIELKADGGPSVFSIDVNVLRPNTKEDMVVLQQYDVEKDEFHGGTRIVPKNSRHSYTTVVAQVQDENDINEIFY